MNNSILTLTTGGTDMSISTSLLILIISFSLGLIISATYKKATKMNKESKNFALTLATLPVIVAIIIYLIGSNVASAFSLAGAFSIIRFRSEPAESQDVAYVLFAMAAGLASGMGQFLYGYIFTGVLCVFMLIVKHMEKQDKDEESKLLKITVPEDLNYDNVFQDVFDKYLVKCEMIDVKTTALGSLYQLRYDIQLGSGISTKEFLDELRCRNGNLNISLIASK